MSSKAEIEAQIAALQARLHEHLTYDPAFTPAELVRWDPSLVGTAFRIQHELDIPANAFERPMIRGDSDHGPDPQKSNLYGIFDRAKIGNRHDDGVMEMIGVLKHEGIYHVSKLFESTFYRSKPAFIVSNNFDSMTLLPFEVRNNWGRISEEMASRYTHYNLSFKELGVYLNLVFELPQVSPSGILETSKKIYNWILPLANPARLLLDQIYIATSTRIHDKDVITDKYPLSTLYQEWKRDKTAGRIHRRSPLDEAMITISALQEELRLAREARADADAHSEKLRAALHASVGIKESENPV